ncbi:hypothetical protein CSKR_101903 [Clonorchis sinensis]|uniref:Uncharacterized protein n=1 Tax=Clonorchis sinensis TaxID=79923 RepID=A0A419QBS8_CLOSI|nr:hypothetical protein CSKR_101903 [Clonorchis sinensis]
MLHQAASFLNWCDIQDIALPLVYNILQMDVLHKGSLMFRIPDIAVYFLEGTHYSEVSQLSVFCEYGTLGTTRTLSWKASRTDSTQTFRNLLRTLLSGQRSTTSACAALNWALQHFNSASEYLSCAVHRLTNAGTGTRHIFPHIIAQPNTYFLVISLRIRRHQPAEAMVLRQRLSNS